MRVDKYTKNTMDGRVDKYTKNTMDGTVTKNTSSYLGNFKNNLKYGFGI
jgi:hypothetical protein